MNDRCLIAVADGDESEGMITIKTLWIAEYMASDRNERHFRWMKHYSRLCNNDEATAKTTRLPP